MQARAAKRVAAALRPRPRRPVAQWAEENLVLGEGYPSPARGRFSLDYLPYWREPLACLDDPSVDEVVGLKCSQSGGSQGLLIPSALCFAADRGLPVLYCGGQQEHQEAFLEERIKPLLKSSPALSRHPPRERGSELYFPSGGMLVSTHSTSTQGVKSRPIALALGDEQDIWSENSAEKIRSRLRHYPGSKFLLISAPDAKARKTKVKGKSLSPIFQEWETTDRREWFCPDPGAPDKPFRFRLGGPEDGKLPPDGLRWDITAKGEDGVWDLAMVAATAHYVTPSGAVVDDQTRKRLLREGRWMPTNPKATPGRRGYHVSAFLLPMVSMADIACAFLSAKASGTLALQTFFYEWLAEQPTSETDREVAPTALAAREGTYDRGTAHFSVEPYKSFYVGKQTTTFLTADVQQSCLWWLATGHVEGGDCSVIDWGRCFTCEEIDGLGRKYGASRIGIDSNYDVRRSEVLEASWRYQFIPLVGSNSRQLSLPWVATEVDPFAGRKGGGANTVYQVTWQTDVFKQMAADMFSGAGRGKFFLPKNPDHELLRQLLSEKHEDGEWVPKHHDNHLWDALCESLLLAAMVGLSSQVLPMSMRPS